MVSIFLLLFDLPKGFKIGNRTINLSSININTGLFTVSRDFPYKLGLDLQGGTRIAYRVVMDEIPGQDRDSAFESARNIMERRINFFGVSEPTIQTLKLNEEYRIVVELPGLTDVNQALEVIGKTAQLTFWEESPSLGTPLSTESASMLPLGLTFYFKNPQKTQLSGNDLKSAQVIFGSQGDPQVQISFSPEGSKLFADITKRNVGKPVAIVLDDVVIQAPNVEQPILSGDAVISGGFDTETAKNVAIQLNAGALPAPLEVVSQSTIGPSLGIDSLKRSIIGGILGFLSIIVFMTYLYKKAGILASIALGVYVFFVLFIFKTGLFILPPVTLTLAGIAGFILSIGMAVDANILIFERMKEERRRGKPQDIAVKLGFSRAWSSIRDSNISTLITCAILFYFGSGLVRGFALTLAIGVLVSMFSAITVTRNLLRVFAKK